MKFAIYLPTVVTSLISIVKDSIQTHISKGIHVYQKEQNNLEVEVN